MYSAVELSKYIVNKCTSDGHPINNLQLQKMLYYVQRYFLNNGLQAFPDSIEAWQIGPVVPNSYYLFCGFGVLPIEMKYEVDIEQSYANIINPIIEKKRTLNPWDMVEIHKSGGAWDKTYGNGKGNRKEIPVSLIREVG